MYQIEGKEFATLLKREFVKGFQAEETSATLKDKFQCQTKSLRNSDFDILHFNADFKTTVRINKLEDTTHVSLHFELSGKSDASITGFKEVMSMEKGHFNVMNCVDPVSTFTFPEQQKYEYLCIGLKPAFFRQILAECGDNFQEIYDRTAGNESFSLFNRNRKIDHWQHTALALLSTPPVADALKTSYITSKVKELVLLTLNHDLQNNKVKVDDISTVDKERLMSCKAYLSENFLHQLTLGEISRSFMLNEFKLKRGFKKLFGITVFGYIQQLRLNHAYVLLAGGGFSIGEIAAMIGYTSDSAFIRAFGQYYGHSPGKHNLRL
ncbi:helix-turn-helix transcriptional regulator [Pedobacter caeni]|uniref:AraC-type DNA-binding protein n=1 Tax=Pedobacter caeni TaxID=288992 RepID=A0A1M5B3Z4_9SPHI|nr:AraC family transcriptional regulator [Pedobacter caeni]SHF37179.1 AraC-type DNA-binding protein [Pedobacter caeni]